MSGWAQIFKLLASEDVNSHKMDFCVAVLPSFRGTHFHNLAGPALDDDMPIKEERVVSIAKRDVRLPELKEELTRSYGGQSTALGRWWRHLPTLARNHGCAIHTYSTLARWWMVLVIEIFTGLRRVKILNPRCAKERN